MFTVARWIRLDSIGIHFDFWGRRLSNFTKMNCNVSADEPIRHWKTHSLKYSICLHSTDCSIRHFCGVFGWRQCNRSGAYEVSYWISFVIIFVAIKLIRGIHFVTFRLLPSVRHVHEVEPHADGFWKEKWTWKARWVKTWRPKKVYVATWKRVWGPVSIKEWVPFPPKHIHPVPHVTHIHSVPHLSHIQELPHFKR